MLLLIASGANFSAFSVTHEQWLSFGFEFGNFFERSVDRGQPASLYTGSPGLSFSNTYFHYGETIGFTMRGFFAMPMLTSSGSFEDHSLRFQIGLIMGAAFRYIASENLTLKSAVGINWLVSFLDYAQYRPSYGRGEYETVSHNWGLGADLGLKFNLTNTVFLSAGSIVFFDFARFAVANVSYRYRAPPFVGRSSGWAEGFFMFGFRPYIAVGFRRLHI